MNHTDRRAFVNGLSAVYALYRVELTPPVIEIWWRALEGYELASVLEALGRHARNPDAGMYIPKPADVVREIGGTTRDVALLAWSKVERGVKDVGAYRSVVFDDPFIHRVLEDLGGWEVVCRTETKEWQFLEKRFIDRYRAEKARGVVPPHAPRLPGNFERVNRFLGYADARHFDVVRIGDPEICAVIESGADSSVPKLGVSLPVKAFPS